MTIDNPHVRNEPVCPICDYDKPIGNVVCWGCYRSLGMKYGNRVAEAAIARREARLAALASD